MSPTPAIALIGFGEVGQTLAEDLLAVGVTRLSAFDTAFDAPDSLSSRRLSATPGVTRADSHLAAACNADLVISAVTAAQDVEAAKSVAPGLRPSAFFLDLNSASPGMKQASAKLIDRVGGRYIEAAVMSPIGPKRISSPMLLGGAHAQAFLALAGPLGFIGAQPYSDVIGKASAAKMCRSVVIKGLEALLTESLLAARHYDVLDTVVGSLSDLLPLPDWETRSRYMISRSVEHGVRRAEEMRESAATVADAGVEPLMTRMTALRQDRAAAHIAALSHTGLAPMLDAILQEMRTP